MVARTVGRILKHRPGAQGNHLRREREIPLGSSDTLRQAPAVVGPGASEQLAVLVAVPGKLVQEAPSDEPSIASQPSQDSGVPAPPQAARVVQPELTHARGYNDFGGNRAEWARRVALDTLAAGGHFFPPAQVEAVGQGTRCSRCLLDFPASRLVGLAKSDPGCQGDLFTLGPVPRQSPQVRDPAGIGTILRVKGLQIDPSHNLRHFAGALWCSKCGGIVNLVMPASKTGAPHLRAVCKEVPSSKPYGRGLVQLAALDAPSHLKGGWPGASNLSLKGFV